MILDSILLVTFAVSAYTLWYRISIHLPELTSIPDDVIMKRLDEDSARLKIFILQFRTFYRERHHVDLFWNFSSKVLYRIHIFLLRFDNAIVRHLQNIRVRMGGNGSNGKNEYWKKNGGEPEIEEIKDHRVEEIRRK